MLTSPAYRDLYNTADVYTNSEKLSAIWKDEVRVSVAAE